MMHRGELANAGTEGREEREVKGKRELQVFLAMGVVIPAAVPAD
jgi:hypothetical protein